MATANLLLITGLTRDGHKLVWRHWRSLADFTNFKFWLNSEQPVVKVLVNLDFLLTDKGAL